MRADEIRALAVGPASRPGSPCSTCAAAWPGPGGSSPGSSAAATSAWTPAPAPSASHVNVPATCPVGSRSRRSPGPAGPVRRGAPAGDHARLPGQAAAAAGVSRALAIGGRFAFTLEEGLPLTEAERAQHARRRHGLAHAAAELLALLERVGLQVRWQDDCSRAHRAMADVAASMRSSPMRRTSPRRSAAGRSTSCSPLTGSGATGCATDGSASSLSSRRRSSRRRSPTVSLCSQQQDLGRRPTPVHRDGMTDETRPPGPLPMSELTAHRLLHQRIIVLGDEVDDRGGNRLCAQLLLLSAEDPRPDISLYINSPGGSVPAMLAIYDVMRLIPNDVAHAGDGPGGERGAVPAVRRARRGKRYALPHARVLHAPGLGRHRRHRGRHRDPGREPARTRATPCSG